MGLYIADWVVNGKTHYFANDMNTVVAYVFKNRILKGKTRYQVIDDVHGKHIAIVFSGTMGSKKKDAKIQTGVLFIDSEKVYSILPDGSIGKQIPSEYGVVSEGFIDGFSTLRAAQQKAVEILSRSKKKNRCMITHVWRYHYVGEVTKSSTGAIIYTDLKTGRQITLDTVKKSVKKVPAPFGL